MIRKYAYWISTALLCLLYIASATMYLTMGDQVRQSLVGLGYPAYLDERDWFAELGLPSFVATPIDAKQRHL